MGATRFMEDGVMQMPTVEWIDVMDLGQNGNKSYGTTKKGTLSTAQPISSSPSSLFLEDVGYPH